MTDPTKRRGGPALVAMSLLAALPLSLAGSLAPGELVVELRADGEVAVDGALLDDPLGDEGPGELRARLAGAAEDGVSAVRLEAQGNAPFETVQAVLASCWIRDVGIERVSLQVAEREPRLRLTPWDGEDAGAPRLRVDADGRGELRLRSYLGDEVEEYATPAEAARSLAEVAALEPVVLDARRGTSCAQIAALAGALAEGGVGALELAPLEYALQERSLARWEAITAGDWESVYEYQAPALREAQPKADFLAGKELHRYTDVREHRVFALRRNRAWSTLHVDWTPLHPELANADPAERTQELDVVETWQWTDGEWYWQTIQRTGDFLAAHSELAEEFEAR